jgi:hypothetical protein
MRLFDVFELTAIEHNVITTSGLERRLALTQTPHHDHELITGKHGLAESS